MKHNLYWFTNRIGKRIFRDTNFCSCADCKEVFEKGLIVRDEDHARYLEMVQCDLDFNYADKKYYFKK